MSNTTMVAWRQWRDSPWGRLRYTLAAANLARHLGPEPLRVLDLAGGDGGDAIPLALLGHHVTIVDRSADMLAAAAEDAGAAGVAVDLVEADVAHHGLRGFDVVLCHNLIQYVDDVTGCLATALAPLRPGGLLSVMALNRHSAPLLAAIRDTDPATALAVLDTDQARTVTLDTAVTLHTAEDIGDRLDLLGCPVAVHYGIRAFCDYIADDGSKSDPAFYAELERLELAVTARQPYPHLARLFQLVGFKRG
jgi:S-adenosylmethionine-dependent methyltransferase